LPVLDVAWATPVVVKEAAALPENAIYLLLGLLMRQN